MNPSKICNAVRMDIEGVSQTGLPLDGFPQEFQTLVLDLVRENRFNLEFTVTSLLSALATAIGNSLRLKIRGNWEVNASLFILIVGRAGLGKTPPMSFAYTPIADLDYKMIKENEQELDRYFDHANKEQNVPRKKPSVCKTILDDVTIEAMMSRHSNNYHGIVLKIDEIRSLFKRVVRSGDDTVEKLLTAYSGQMMSVDRKTNDTTIVIPHPCINMIGGVQTQLLNETMTQEMIANGFFDRCIFCFPKKQTLDEVEVSRRDKSLQDSCKVERRWSAIINKVLSLSDFNTWKSPDFPVRELEFSEDGEQLFCDFENKYVRIINAIVDDSLALTRYSKLSNNCARFALIIQVLRWVCGESHVDYVDEVSVKLAIRLIDYYEDCYSRVRDKIVKEEVPDGDAWLENLPDTFSSVELRQAGFAYGMQYRTIYDHVTKLLSLPNPPIRRVGKGKYEKVRAKQYSAQHAQCTTAQPVSVEVPVNGEPAVVCADSAVVHCANEPCDPHIEELNNQNEPSNE